MKVIKNIIFVAIVFLISIVLLVVGNGYDMYKDAISKIPLTEKVEKQSGNINVIAKLGYNEKTLIDDTGEYEDNIYIEGVSYYLTIKLDDFKGNIDIISE